MGLSVNILTSGFLVTVVIFFLLMGILFYSAYAKIGQVLLENDSSKNDLERLDSCLNSVKVAYILAFIGAGLALLLALLYAGHETVVTPSEYWHLALYLITYALLIISVIYAFIALNKLYDTRITQRNGADAYLWAGLLMSIFAFVGLTATGSGRLGMNIVRSGARSRLEAAESKINEHLPAIRGHVEETRANIEAHLPAVRSKVDQIHSNVVSQNMGAGSQSIFVPQSPREISNSLNMASSLPPLNSQMGQSQLLPQQFGQPCNPASPTLRRV
jgi:hypothetical protein